MGARPVANLNALRFGSPDHPKTRHLVSGVVSGIGGYGNCVGIPTVAGEVNFHPAYNGNILVNAMTVGIARTDRIFYSAAAGPGNAVVYVGAKTGRDGIHGATMASAEFNEDSEEKRPTVQVGDPFTEKLLLEACLELMERDCIVAIQDMGAAGLTSSSVEMAGKGGLGIELDLDRVPVREDGMTAYEIMLSESQERMLMIIRPESEGEARAVFDKWDLDFAIIGSVTETGHIVLKKDSVVQADIPVNPLVSEAPEYDRPHVPAPSRPVIDATEVPPPASLTGALAQIMTSPDMASRRWIWEQYDHLVMGDTMIRPGADSGVVRLQDSNRALAVTVDCTPRYCLADPRIGGAQAVLESWRNLTAVGATPLAVTNNLNFGNPEKPEIMGQIVGCVTGMGEACRTLDYPVVSGNVSLYNETEGQAILPTPVIGGVGLIDHVDQMCTPALKTVDDTVLVIGQPPERTDGWLGASVYLREIAGREDGAPPPVDLLAERRAGDLVRQLIRDGVVTACHDVADGGLLVAVAEMTLAAVPGLGVRLDRPDGATAHAWAFGEDQGRYVVATSEPGAVTAAAVDAGVPVAAVGRVIDNGELTLGDDDLISVETLRRGHEAWLPDYMAAV